MIGQTVSHYRIEEKLGEGGMGVVYRAEDVRLQRPVALKFLPPHLVADAQARERFRREAQAASALDHPNVCVIHEIDETENGDFFIAMAYYTGQSLKEKLTQGPLPVADAIDVTRQVAQGLAKAHNRGIVHRDIKPDNLKVTEDGIWKILDFGIAKLSEATGLTRTGRAPGTVAYMSPEQAASDEATPGSDIWALGVVLYEMLTGRLPFRGATPVATLYQVLNEEPAPVRESRPEVSPELARIVDRALAKDPSARYASVGELLADLAMLPGAGPALEALALRAREAVAAPTRVETPVPFLTPEAAESDALPPFVGRDSELARLEGWLQEALAGRGRVGFIAGEAGTGKTALAAEFCRKAAAAVPALIVATGTCNAHTGAGDPHRPFREILAQLTGDVDARWAAGSLAAEQATRLWGLLPATAAALAQHGPDLAGTFLGEDALMARVQSHASVPNRWIPDFRALLERRARSRLRQADLFEEYVQVLRALAGGRPLLLLVDDLQWADAGSIALLFELGRQLVRSRVLVLGLYRTTDVALGRDGGRHPLESVVHEMAGLFGEARIEFSAAADREFVEALIAAEPNDLGKEFRNSLFIQTRGHALFTVELLRALKEEQYLVRNQEERWVEAGQALDWSRLPARVDAVIGERISRVSAPLQRLLTVASVEGERFTLEAVARVLGSEPRDLIGPLSIELEKKHQLVSAEGLARVDGQRLSIYRFRHILFQRYLYDRLDVVERTHLHEQLGEALEALHAGHEDEIAIALAHQFRQAALPDKAADYFLAAGELSERSLAVAEALRFYETSLQQLLSLPQSEERDRRELYLQLAIGNARMRVPAPGYPEACARALTLAEEVGTATQRFWAVQGLLWVTYYAGHWEEAEAFAQRCLSVARETQDDGLLAHAHACAGEVVKQRGDRRAAARHFEEAINLYNPDLHRRFEFLDMDTGMFTRSVWGLVEWELGYPEKSRALFDDANALARQAEDAATLPMLLMRDSLCRMWSGEIADARAKCQEAFAAMEKSGGIHAVAPLILSTQGFCDTMLGRPFEGVESIRRGLGGWEGAGMKVFVAGVAACLARALSMTGHPEDGLQLLRTAMADPLKNEPANSAEVHRHLGELYLALPQPDVEAAETAFRTAIEIARGQEARSWELLATTSLARLLQRQGRVGEAREMLGSVYGWFTEGHDLPYLRDARGLLDELDCSTGTGTSLQR